MKPPAFFRTIGFRLAVWYTVLFIILGIMLVIGINLSMWQAERGVMGHFRGSGHSNAEIASMVSDSYQDYLRTYSLISFSVVVVAGIAGSYILSRRTLKTIDNVTGLAQRISKTNLKDRINHKGPDDEMKRLADTFDNMLDRLENAFESQNRFVQDASHELRTPIAIAQTNLDVLEMEKQPKEEDYKRLVEVLRLSIERMSKLNDKLLVLSRENRLDTEWGNVDMAALLNEIAIEFETSAASSGIKLELEPPPQGLSLKGDAFSLKQAVSNIVENAIKYNRPGGSVVITAVKEKGGIIIKISDTGIGISREEQKRIFDRFYRVDKSRSRAQGGSGLGLAMVKQIIENHKGRVTVESLPGEGSTFTVWLPVSAVR